MLGDNSGSFIVPSGDGKGAGVAVDIDAIAEGERRLGEVATVTPLKAPELRAALGTSWRKTRELVAKVYREKLTAENTVKGLRAIALLSSKGDSADVRAAAADTDKGVEEARDRLVEIAAALMWLEDKATGFKTGYFDVSKAIGGVIAPPAEKLHAKPQPIPVMTVPVVVPGTPPPKPTAPDAPKRSRPEPPL